MTSPKTSGEHTDDASSGVLVTTRQDRELAVGTWLLLAADSRDRALEEWRTGGIALLRCGIRFTAVRIDAGLIHAAAGSDTPEKVKEFLAEVLHGGPVFVDQHSRRYYALVPSSEADRSEWSTQRRGAACLARGSFLGVPRFDLGNPDDAFSYWVVPMDGPGDLCPVAAVAQLVAYGHSRSAEGRP
ncbi:hypothetical protein [Streptomyces griseorubiginosus]|uniref:hypothetical protein n=1 Tax=Streptomyces griseorubiginosus TaxID=67304 RepID=UPI00340321BC